MTAVEATIAPRPRKRKPTPPEQRRVLVDQRTRVARRLRTVENELRDQLRAQGRVVLVHDDIMIGHLAQCMVSLETMRGDASRGLRVDDEQLTRLANTAQRLVNQLGLKPAILEAPREPVARPSLTQTLKRMGKS